MRGKVIENLLYENVVSPVQSAVEATLYNGSAITVSNNGIDVMDFPEVNFILNTGVFVGTAALNVVIVESDTNNPTTATAVSGVNASGTTVSAAFTQVTTANDAQVHVASLKNTKRYLWARTYQNAATCVFGIVAAKKGNFIPVSQTPIFDIEY